MTMLQDADGGKDRFLLWSAAIAFFMIGSFGVWTIYVWIALWNDWTFFDLRQFSFLLIPLLLLLVPIALRVSLRIVSDSTGRPPGQTQRTKQTATLRTHAEPLHMSLRWLFPALLLLVASLALTATKSDGSFSWQWLLFAIACLLLVFVGFGKPGMSFSTIDSPDRPKSAFFQRLTTRRDAYWYLSTVVFLLVAYAFRTNTDADDTHFLGAVVSLLQFPDTPLFTYDSIFGEEGIPNYIFIQNSGQSLEALVAFLSSALDVDHLLLYYWWVPIAFLLIVPIPIVLFVKPYYPDFAWIGVVFALLFLLDWSTDNHNAGHFFVPRFFQGKALLVTLVVPAIFLAVRAFVQQRSVSLFIIIVMLLVSGAGVTSTGLYAAPVAAGIAFLAFTPLDKRSLAFYAMVLLSRHSPTS